MDQEQSETDDIFNEKDTPDNNHVHFTNRNTFRSLKNDEVCWKFPLHFFYMDEFRNVRNSID